MYCMNCGNALQDQDNFCRRCGAKIGKNAASQTSTAPNQETPAQKLWKLLGQAVVLQVQQQAIANAMQQRSGDNFWSGGTASGNDNGSSGYVDAGGYIVGYDR